MFREECELRFPGSEFCSQGFEVRFLPLEVMSFARNRGVSRGTLGGLGLLGGRPVGRGGSYGFPSVSSRFSLSGSDTPSELFPIVHPGNRVAVVDLQAKGAIEPAPSTQGYYSRLFVTPKVNGGWRLVIDLSCLNRSVLVSHFHMETAQSVLQSLRSGNWMVSQDLQDAYLQVPVHPSRHYLRFCVGDSVLQFRALCFGLSTAPQVFTRVMAPISSIMQSYGFRILLYLYDWLILGSLF